MSKIPSPHDSNQRKINLDTPQDNLGYAVSLNYSISDAAPVSQPEVASLRKTLEVNRAYQNLLKDQLKRIDKAREENQSLQLKNLPSRPKTAHPIFSQRMPGTPYFVASSGELPPDNVDTLNRRETAKAIAVTHRFRKWNKTEQKSLQLAVLQAAQRSLVDSLLEQYQNSGRPLENFTLEVEQIRNLPEVELLRSTQNIDWESVAKSVPARTAVDCRIQWANNDDPRISRAGWGKDEDKRLKELAQKYKGHSWEIVADELQTGRVAHQCLSRYQKRLNTSMKKSKWSDPDDLILLAAVKRYGEKNWQQVASCLEGRTAQQCLHRYKKALDPTIRRGKWREDEDRMLEQAVQAYGCRNWSKIQLHVPGRTDVQCRERWVNVLNPELNNGPWSAEEDQKLVQAIQLHGLGKWAAVSQALYPRTDNQCWRRWKIINAEQAEDYRNSAGKRRVPAPAESEAKRVHRPSLPDIPEPFPALQELSFQEEMPLRIEDGQASLPLVFPSSVTFTALYRLLQTLDVESHRAPFPSTACLDHINTTDFQLMASWFNSLFLYPLLVIFSGMVQERDHE